MTHNQPTDLSQMREGEGDRSTDGPRQIWLEPTCCSEHRDERLWSPDDFEQCDCDEPKDSVRYVRADLAASLSPTPQVSGWREEVERIAAFLETSAMDDFSLTGNSSDLGDDVNLAATELRALVAHLPDPPKGQDGRDALSSAMAVWGDSNFGDPRKIAPPKAPGGEEDRDTLRETLLSEITAWSESCDDAGMLVDAILGVMGVKPSADVLEALRTVRDRFFRADQPERDRDLMWDMVNDALKASDPTAGEG